ncbi:hypothetical protein SCHPADRAFT_989699 [Schizopora paradoxa]|uniref:Uncharacterized protein n=1 Tax=Schizopora paradoxa TaxID=27342 RepID=A0A0H2R4P3_9AGAM|nr:hypothetical protein SCHPADRAFT_989699 [Schizopora paradoxa]
MTVIFIAAPSFTALVLAVLTAIASRPALVLAPYPYLPITQMPISGAGRPLPTTAACIGILDRSSKIIALLVFRLQHRLSRCSKYLYSDNQGTYRKQRPCRGLVEESIRAPTTVTACSPSKPSIDPHTLSSLPTPISRTMPLFSRRQKEPHMIHSDVEVVGLSRVDTISTVDSLATIDNQPGAGRTVGLLYTYLGSELEDAINKRAERLGLGSNAPAAQLDSNSTINSDATTDDQPGAGRTVGRFLAWLGSKVERAANEETKRLRIGPKAIADEICRLSRHREIWVKGTLKDSVCLPVAPGRRFNKSETKTLRTLCKKLIEHTRSHIIGNQLIALEEIINLSMKDPRIRAILVYCDLNRVLPCYDEPELLGSTAKALGAVEFSNVHRVWAPVITLFTTPWREFHGEYDLPEGLEEAIFETIRDPSTSFLSARYFQRVAENINPIMLLHMFLRRFASYYTRVASENPGCVEWSTFYACGNLPPTTNKRALLPIDDILNMAAYLDPEIFIHRLSSSLVEVFSTLENNNFSIAQYGGNMPWLARDSYNTDVARLYKLLSDFTGSTDYWMHLSFIHHLSDKARSSLKGTIFANKITCTYCVLICHTITRHYNMKHLTEENMLTDMCTPLVSFVESDCFEEHSLATTLAVKLCTTNRYCKLMVLRTANKISAKIHLAVSHNLASTNIAKTLKSSESELTSPERIFPPSSWDNLKALYRVSRLNSNGFCIFGKSPCLRKGIICVDKMILGENVTEFISVDAYTHVEDGASFVRYRREVYDDFGRLVTVTEERTSKFDVLVLRYDPVDYRSPLTEGELMDPTGPLGWKNVYTRMEVSLADYLDWFP